MPIRVCSLRWWLVMLAYVLVWSGGWPSLAAQEAPSLSPALLPGILAEGAAGLGKDIQALKDQGKALKTGQEAETRDFQEFRGRVLTLKASMAVKELSPKEAEVALKEVEERLKQVEALHKEVEARSQALRQRQEERSAAFATLNQEIRRLETARHPVLRAKDVRQSFSAYQNLGKQYEAAAAEVKGIYERRLKSLEEERRFLEETREQLKTYAEEAWKAELLKRQTAVPLWRQLTGLGESLLALPGRVAAYGRHLVQSGALAAFLRAQAAPLVGLVAFFLVLIGLSHRLKARFLPVWQSWRQEVEDRGLKTAILTGEIILSRLFVVGVAGWLALGLWSLGLWEHTAARLTLLAVMVGAALRFTRPFLKAVFAGEARGGILPLDDATARFYRRHLWFLLTYTLVAGVFGLSAARRLGLSPGDSYLLTHLFQVGWLLWAWWLLRRRSLEPLLLELPGPAWLRRPGFFRLVRGLVLLVLGIIVFTSLLGFQNLSVYLARGTALTVATVLLLWLLLQALKPLVGGVLHPERGWLAQKYPKGQSLLGRAYPLLWGGVAALLAAGGLVVVFRFWGLKPEKIAWLFQWLTWGPAIGPVVVSPLSLGLTVLTLYLGSWLSRLVRGLLEGRFFPKTDWDKGVQYTIATTLHYTIWILAILTALNVLGFPLTNLALIAGALGVGIGFGLQNIVNNFISGLILLFERPIKVGDLLVIDGQWGKVREIRVRSTTFETLDRAVVIIPNSELLSSKITNWTRYGKRPVRISLEVGVGYGADVRLVTRLLEDICRAHPRVLKDHPVQVFFRTFGDSALQFTVRLFVRSPEPQERLSVTHDLNQAILEAFRDQGIEIPFPQRDLHLRSWPQGFLPSREDTE
jgi:potassium efflux system protein